MLLKSINLYYKFKSIIQDKQQICRTETICVLAVNYCAHSIDTFQRYV